MRQAHRAALQAAGVHVGPAWVVGGLLVATLLSTGMVAGSTGGAGVRSPGSTGERQAPSAVSVVAPPIGLAESVSSASVDTYAGAPRAALQVRGQALAALETDAARSPTVASARPRQVTTPVPTAAAHPTATPRPTATPVPKATAHPAATADPKATADPTAEPVKKPTAPAIVAATPRPASTPMPKPAIVYPHRATGRATWGHFGGAVVTRLPPGTRIRVCGRLGCWEGVSSGYGPSPDGGNLVDLDAAVFHSICGALAAGVGSVVLSWR